MDLRACYDATQGQCATGLRLHDHIRRVGAVSVRLVRFAGAEGEPSLPVEAAHARDAAHLPSHGGQVRAQALVLGPLLPQHLFLQHQVHLLPPLLQPEQLNFEKIIGLRQEGIFTGILYPTCELDNFNVYML